MVYVFADFVSFHAIVLLQEHILWERGMVVNDESGEKKNAHFYHVSYLLVSGRSIYFIVQGLRDIFCVTVDGLIVCVQDLLLPASMIVCVEKEVELQVLSGKRESWFYEEGWKPSLFI